MVWKFPRCDASLDSLGLSGMHSNNQHTRLSCWGRVYGAFSTCVEGFGCGYLFLCWLLLHIPCGRVSAADLMTCTLGSNPPVVILEQRCVWLRCPAMSTQTHARLGMISTWSCLVYLNLHTLRSLHTLLADVSARSRRGIDDRRALI